MTTVLTEQCAKSAEDPPSCVSPDRLFVSTSLATWRTANPGQFAWDFQINDTVYRRLDPEYYVWLRSRMVVAKKAATAGHLAAAAFEASRVRFNAVHEWAVEHFGEAQMLAAVRAFRAGEYTPPVAQDHGPRVPPPRPWRCDGDHVAPEVVAMVDAISEYALSLGWKHARLYGTGACGMFGPRRGLVCYLKTGDRIGEVTVQSIEIIHPLPAEVRHRFYNPDADQPWIIRIDGEKK